MQMHQSVGVKRELSIKADLSIKELFYIPTLTYGHDLWVVTERMKSQTQVAFEEWLDCPLERG